MKIHRRISEIVVVTNNIQRLPNSPEAAWKIENYQAALLEIILAANIGVCSPEPHNVEAGG